MTTIPSIKNVLGTELKPCCYEPMTGFYRDGSCKTGPNDFGKHLICVRVNKEFLNFSKEQGNDLSTPMPEYEFPGLVPGDQWCLCATRWRDALDAGMAPPVILEATHIGALQYVTIEDLKRHAFII